MTASVDIVDAWLIPLFSAKIGESHYGASRSEPSRLRPSMTGWWLSLPLWKIWISQLGWWHSQYDGKIKTCSKPPTRWVGLQQTDPVGGVKHHFHESAEIHWFSRQSRIRPLPPSNPLRTLNQLNHGEKRWEVSAPVRAEPPSSGKCTDGLSTHFNTFHHIDYK